MIRQLLSISTLFLIGLLVSCSNSTDSKTPKSVVVDTTKSQRPPKNFYGDLNFVVDSTGQIYYHEKKCRLFACGDGANIGKPQFIGLRPEDLKIISLDTLDSFIKSKSQGIDMSKFKAVAQYVRDSISKELVAIEVSLFKNEKRLYEIDKITEETKYVLDAKRKKTKYDPSKIKWSDDFYLKPIFKK
ncbi:hypothetical protein NF867_07130 [Solitalea sp. MAHUQ-68]|uniref:Lipoprotein n=1 Tax=Solitalea agri TaxID=2953739 RepID=A0A9X2JC28_9SPHI|nr:hypothetical protein [Solitalea agri]MCO4292628.1 hypothetical protein [Solitalea agri]